MEKEWYISEYERKIYLHNLKLRYRQFDSRERGHDHCELCWGRFSDYPDDLHFGYYAPTRKFWICPDCFKHYGTLFGWSAEITPPEDGQS